MPVVDILSTAARNASRSWSLLPSPQRQTWAKIIASANRCTDLTSPVQSSTPTLVSGPEPTEHQFANPGTHTPSLAGTTLEFLRDKASEILNPRGTVIAASSSKAVSQSPRARCPPAERQPPARHQPIGPTAHHARPAPAVGEVAECEAVAAGVAQHGAVVELRVVRQDGSVFRRRDA
jgi:hypothetical protein